MAFADAAAGFELAGVPEWMRITPTVRLWQGAAHRSNAMMVCVSVPGERWEIEFLGDGSVEVECFTSTGDIAGEVALHELLTRFAEEEPAKII